MEFFSPWHLVLLAVVTFVLFFGWKQLPDMSRSLGRSLRIFKTEIKGMTEDDKAREHKQDEPPAAAPAPRQLPKAEVVLNKAEGVPNKPSAPRRRPTPGRPAPRPTANSQGK